MRTRSIVILTVGIAGAAAAGLLWIGTRPSPDHIVTPVLPTLSPTAVSGQQIYSDNCSACHGENGGGSDNGPPLIHRIYEPNHHGDGSFQVAVLRGVRAHHWPFGNMPPIKGIGQKDVAEIVAFVREVQAANGIN